MMSAAMMDDMIDDEEDDEDDDEDNEDEDEDEDLEEGSDDQDMQSAGNDSEIERPSAFEDLEDDEVDEKVYPARAKKNDKALFRPPTTEEMEMLKREGEDRGSSFGFSMKVSAAQPRLKTDAIPRDTDALPTPLPARSPNSSQPPSSIPSPPPQALTPLPRHPPPYLHSLPPSTLTSSPFTRSPLSLST